MNAEVGDTEEAEGSGDEAAKMLLFELEITSRWKFGNVVLHSLSVMRE